ncbi:MAG: YfhO family protein [Acidobacteria bacterium]|nr:YfhO family protein [Acidobacteriota bacterium]
MSLDWWNQHKRGLTVVAVSAAFFLFFFWRVIFGGRFFLAGDQLVYTWPMRTIAWEMIRHGQLPLWTPFLFSGYPLLSMAQLGLGYPLTWGYLFLPGHWAEHVVILAPYLLSPIFTYAYLREVGRSRVASLLGGLSFAYGGLMVSGIGLNGMLPNAMMWAPLLLIAIERSRISPTKAHEEDAKKNRTDFARCVLLAAGAYSMSVLSGIGQGFVYTGLLAVTYAVFIVVVWPTDVSQAVPSFRTFARWRPLATIVTGMLLAAGVAAFQILESRQAQRLSVRSGLSYEQFSDGAFHFSMAWKSWLDPFHIKGDVTAYVPPLVVLLALIAVVTTLRKRQRELRIFFWLAVAIVAWILMCGPNTPVYELAFKIPLLNLFRVPSRHVFEWTLAASILAAYGWDIAESWLSKKLFSPTKTHEENTKTFALFRHSSVVFAVLGLAVSLAIGAAWHHATGSLLPTADPKLEAMSYPYIGWKLAFVAATVFSVLAIWQIGNQAWREKLLMLTVALICFVEPFNFLEYLTPPYSSPVERLSHFSPTTKQVQQNQAAQNRVYSQVTMEGDEMRQEPRFDLPNQTALAGLHNVAGFEPLMPERYSRALNSKAWDTVNRGPNLEADPSLFESRSHVLDLLNTTHVISFDNFGYNHPSRKEKDGLIYDGSVIVAELDSDSPTVMPVENFMADQLAVVTAMSRSIHIPDQTAVARITIRTTDGQIIERELLAGSDTSEWAHERPDVKAKIKHSLATVFDSQPADAQNSFSALRFLKRFSLEARLNIARVEMTKLVKDADVAVWNATLIDSQTSASQTLHHFDTDRWETEYKKDGVMVARNKRALPRIWLATEAEALDATQIWLRIRGLPDPKTQIVAPFDPGRTALIEIEPAKLPKLSGGELAPDAYARFVSYEASRLVIETNADKPAVLVVSERHYPGWVATLDGVKTPIHQTDFLLRGVVVPAGKHTVEMSYRAPQARNGAIISLLTLGLIGWLWFRARRNSSAGAV